MVNTIIIEDDKYLANQLMEKLKTFPEINVLQILHNVKDSIEYFANKENKADLIFSDVQMPDGTAFEIFDTINISSPIVFVTAYDQFIMEAFDYNSIDYIMKPVQESSLAKSVNKFYSLKRHFSDPPPQKNLSEIFQLKKKRILVKKGSQYIALNLDEVVLFFTENKLVYAVDKQQKKFLVDKNLGDLEKCLDSSVFFRANRQFLLNINFIKGFKSYEKVKLLVDLTIPDLDFCIIISQENAANFKKWISEA